MSWAACLYLGRVPGGFAIYPLRQAAQDIRIRMKGEQNGLRNNIWILHELQKDVFV